MTPSHQTAPTLMMKQILKNLKHFSASSRWISLDKRVRVCRYRYRNENHRRGVNSWDTSQHQNFGGVKIVNSVRPANILEAFASSTGDFANLSGSSFLCCFILWLVASHLTPLRSPTSKLKILTHPRNIKTRRVFPNFTHPPHLGLTIYRILNYHHGRNHR